MSEFARLAGLEPLYKVDLDPEIDKAKAREAVKVELERRAKERENQSILDDQMKVMAGLKKPAISGTLDVDENLDMARPEDPKDIPESRSKSLAAKKAFVKKIQAKYGRKMPGFDPEDYPPIKGMEGPFYMKTKGGRKVLYYDPREGEYYDRKSDMYFPVNQLESVRRIAVFNEGARYEVVVNGKLKATKNDHLDAVTIAMRHKGSVQVVDSKTGKIWYDSEVKDSRMRSLRKQAKGKVPKGSTPSMQAIRLQRRG